MCDSIRNDRQPTHRYARRQTFAYYISVTANLRIPSSAASLLTILMTNPSTLPYHTHGPTRQVVQILPQVLYSCPTHQARSNYTTQSCYPLRRIVKLPSGAYVLLNIELFG
jgi:hypothetical protein